MMKNTHRTVLVRKPGAIRCIAIIALAAVIGFSMTGCAQLSSLLSSPSIDGVWVNDGGHTVTISGNSGVFTVISSASPWPSAVEKNYVKIGDLKYRDIKSTGDLKWSGQQLNAVYTGSVATGTRWENCTFTLSKDGRTLRAGNTTFTRQ